MACLFENVNWTVSLTAQSRASYVPSSSKSPFTDSLPKVGKWHEPNGFLVVMPFERSKAFIKFATSEKWSSKTSHFSTGKRVAWIVKGKSLFTQSTGARNTSVSDVQLRMVKHDHARNITDAIHVRIISINLALIFQLNTIHEVVMYRLK